MQHTPLKPGSRTNLGRLLDEVAVPAMPTVLAQQRLREAEFASRLKAMRGSKQAELALLQEYWDKDEAERKARLEAWKASQSQAQPESPAAKK